MRDNLRRSHAIRNALTQGYPVQPTGNRARHLHTRAALISGMVGSKSTQLPNVAAPVPHGTKPESRVQHFARWFDNAPILEEGYFLPDVDIWLRQVALQTLGRVMDGSGVGRGCTALMIPVVEKGRALPRAWRVRQAPQGHVPEALHIAVVELVRGLLPVGAQGVLLGDGACDGTGLQQTLQQAGWSSVCRTGNHRTASWDGEPCRLDTLGACSQPGTWVAVAEVCLTREA